VKQRLAAFGRGSRSSTLIRPNRKRTDRDDVAIAIALNDLSPQNAAGSIRVQPAFRVCPAGDALSLLGFLENLARNIR
jgi:hypothetical protein